MKACQCAAREEEEEEEKAKGILEWQKKKGRRTLLVVACCLLIAIRPGRRTEGGAANAHRHTDLIVEFWTSIALHACGNNG